MDMSGPAPSVAAAAVDSVSRRTLPALLELSARWKGDDVLLEDEHEALTAPAVLDAVQRAAGGLVEAGVGKGDTVAFLVGSSVRHAVTLFACAQIGALPCALHARDVPLRLAHVVDWLGARLLVTDADRDGLAREVQRLTKVRPRLLALSAAVDGDALAYGDLVRSAPRTTCDVTDDDPAYIILSSGTTGEPKGIVHRHRTGWAAGVMGGPVYGDIGRSDRLLIPMAPSFAAWFNLSLPFLAARSTLVFRGRYDPAAYVADLVQARITYAALTPTLWRLALRAADSTGALEHVRYAFFSGEPGSADLIAAIADVLPSASIRQAYLSSEGGAAAGVVADHELLVTCGRPTAAGLPAPGADLRVVALGGSPNVPLASGEVGEIALTGASLADTYWADNDQTHRRFVDGWWLTGDIGYQEPDGHVYVTGRTDNVINTGGVKVHAEEVEAALLSHPDIELAAVVGVTDETWGTAIEAHVVARTADLTEADILAYCRSLPTLPVFKVPKRVVFHETLPTTATGKISRRALRPGAPPPAA